MRTSRLTGLTIACITGLLGLPAPSAAADGQTLYVSPAAQCSDTGTGTAAVPFCTVTAAARIAQPGQTVQVAGVNLNEAIQITSSGTQDHPIVIRGSDSWPDQPTADITVPASTQHVLTLSGVHDVVIEGFTFSSPAVDPVLVKDSSRVVLDRDYVSEDSQQTPSTAGIRISGQSDHVTVSRSVLNGTHGIAVDAQVQNTTIAGNDLSFNYAGPIRVTDALGTVITNNTVLPGCGSGISLLGSSSGATVENNIVVATPNACSTPADGQIVVSAGSAAGTKVDYNIVHPVAGTPAYNWAGTDYATAADLQAKAQQGAHDLDSAITFNTAPWDMDQLTDADTAAIKSADPNAPGIPATDLLGYAPIDDPKVPTPPGGTLLDRGAYQLQGLTDVQLSVKAKYATPQGPAPLTTTFSATATNIWPTKLTYTYNFGDGTTPQVTDQATTTHVYTTPGSYDATVTVTDGLGGKVVSPSGTAKVTVTATDAHLQPAFTVKPVDSSPLTYSVDASASTGPWAIADYTVDYGDGTAPTSQSYASFTPHTYAEPGTYTVTLTTTDQSGTKAGTSQQLAAAYSPAGYVAVAPTRVLDTRLAPNGGGTRPGPNTTINMRVTRALDGSHPVPYGATAVVLNLTATGATDDSFLAAYPTGTKVPTASNVNFRPGHDISNVVTVPVAADGTINIYNHVGSVDVVADVLGYYEPATGSKFTPDTPARLLDTRENNTPLGTGGVRSLQVAGISQVPANATAVALNVTATGGSDDSFLTVYPTGQNRPAQASNVNFSAGTDTPNQVIVPVGANGSIDIFNHVGNVNVIVDVFGYYSADGKGLFTPVVPKRLIDTRNGNGPVGASGTLPVNGVPGNASAAVLNVTATDTTENSYLTVFADGTQRPGTSNLNLQAGATVPNHVITPVSGTGAFDVYNHVGSTDVIADLFGYFTNS